MDQDIRVKDAQKWCCVIILAGCQAVKVVSLSVLSSSRIVEVILLAAWLLLGKYKVIDKIIVILSHVSFVQSWLDLPTGSGHICFSHRHRGRHHIL